MEKNTRHPDDEGGIYFYGVRCGPRTGKEVSTQTTLQNILHYRVDRTHKESSHLFGAPGTPNCISIWDCQQVELPAFVSDQMEGVGKEVPQPKDVSSTPCEVLIALYRAGVYALTQSNVLLS
ncbi:jg19405 [Pararge aegeria aegeria]|uniref:Jg19405 protein n=1 Tax=Pararge aegeria aegeria TaxID=348720 RepID=A0A8S4R8C3_9NEOP|nr:jg19405 [Pararge aegeria aegeria]